VTALVYRKAIHLKAGATSAGIVTNMIANDAAIFEQITIFAPYLWCAGAPVSAVPPPARMGSAGWVGPCVLMPEVACARELQGGGH
jgi:hypothetical protein